LIFKTFIYLFVFFFKKKRSFIFLFYFIVGSEGLIGC
jgi:hypothetical protein